MNEESCTVTKMCLCVEITNDEESSSPPDDNEDSCQCSNCQRGKSKSSTDSDEHVCTNEEQDRSENSIEEINCICAVCSNAKKEHLTGSASTHSKSAPREECDHKKKKMVENDGSKTDDIEYTFTITEIKMLTPKKNEESKYPEQLPPASTVKPLSDEPAKINVAKLVCQLELQEQEKHVQKDKIEAKEVKKEADGSVIPDWKPIKESNVPIIWLLGRPGTGKETQAQNIIRTLPGFVHISTGDLLRAEVEKGTQRGQLIGVVMKQGGLVPNRIVQELLNVKMLAELPNAKVFLIDGYPREKDQADEFIKDAKPPKKIIYLDAPDDVILNRLKKRGETSGREDDNEASARRRLEQAKVNDAPILEAYESQILKINTDKTPEEVFPDIQSALLEDMLLS